MKVVKSMLIKWLPLFIVILVIGVAGKAQQIPAGYQAKGIVPVGYTDMNGRPAFKLSIKEHKGRWYLFSGQFWHSGWSVVDVTDASNPRVAKFIDGPPNTWTLQMELHGAPQAHKTIWPDAGR